MNLLKNFKCCPNCASTELRIDEHKALVCVNCRFTYFHNTAAAVAAIIEHNSQILLVRRAQEPQISMLDLPGGFVDYNEEAETALRREVNEELNLQIDNIRYFTSAPNIYIYKDVSYYVLDLFFTCRPCNINDIRPKDDVSKLEFFKPDQIPINDLAFESTKTGIERYIASR